ncbi:PLxRFG domain-containing protein [Polynucleobacter sp. UK-Kesae-W10]|uniref:PLxRFG domain-containing protein n=1 Tax=Polynucleobacter sp. UK-Kesae-W10 TaxID=1819738 RepID=UPI001C0AD502|nr:PLxRFG domain-containing protein [Polynucleobacter sp. UK-Kesae-W10]MBU3577606.1 PLxRFG domain-containing protein [Polynucleobacter sp. UK-Kesae-W10]
MTDIFDTLASNFSKSLASTEKAQPTSYSMQPTDSARGQYAVDPATPKSNDGEFTKGFSRSFAEIPGLIAGLGAYGADIVGADHARDAMLKYAKENQDSTEEKYGSDAASLTNVLDGKASAWDFVKNGSGYVTGQALQSLITGGLGAMGVKAMAQKGIVAAGHDLVANELAKGATAEAAKKAGEAFLKDAAFKAGITGATAGAGAQNLGMELGSIYPDAADQAQKEGRQLDGGDLLRVGAAGVGAAALDTAVERANLGKIMGGGKGKSIGSRALHEVPVAMGENAATEYGQTGLEYAGAGKDFFTPEGQREGIDSAAVGSLGGFHAGALASLHQKAEEPNSPLSRAVVATGVAGAPGAPAGPLTPTPDAMPGDTPADTPDQARSGDDKTQVTLPPTDAMGQQVRAIETELRGTNLLDTLRLDGVNVPQIFDDLNTARNLKAPLEQRQEALSAVTELVQWAKNNYKPNGPMDNLATPQPVGVAPAQEPVQVPPVDAAIAALRDDQFNRLLSDNDRQNLIQAIQTSQAKDLPAATRANAANAANEIVGRYQAPQGKATGTGAPALSTPSESLAQAQGNKVTPAEQQFVNPQTGAIQKSDYTQAVDAPRVQIPADKDGSRKDPAFIRRRAAEIKQLVAMGFETVERKGSEFFLINSKTGQNFKLSGMADSQLARKAIADRVNEIAHTAATSPKNDRAEPTKAQIEAGNYKKSDVIELNGMQIKIENPKDSTRRGTSPDGEVWETKMAHHYGEFQGTLGADGDKLDVFVGPRPDSHKVYVIDQNNADGSFDEHKVMMGFTSEQAARDGYLANYEKGWTGLGAITEMSVDQFKSWAKSHEAKKPAAAIADNSAAKVADQSSSPIEKSLKEEQKQDAGKDAGQASFSTYEEAKSYIGSQRRNGSSISALPVPHADGTFGVAIKGTPGYTAAEKYAKQQQKKSKTSKASKAANDEKAGDFKVNVNGEQVSLHSVGKKDLPKDVASATRKGHLRELTQSDLNLLEKLASIFGKTLKVFSEDTAGVDSKIGDGFVRPSEPNAIYIRNFTSVNPVAVFGHEVFHSIKDSNPKAWDSIAKVVREQLGDGAVEKMQGLTYSSDEALDEIVSDIGGDLLSDHHFWKEVMMQIEKDHGKDAKGIIAKLVAHLNDLIDKLIAQIRQSGYGSASMVKDMRAVRAAYKEGLTQYFKESTISRPAVQAQVMREEQNIKRATQRPEDPNQPKVGVHFSKQPRHHIMGSAYGTGLRGMERERIFNGDDARIKNRVSFYVDEGNGLVPESGVGGYAHEIALPKLYDAAKNAEKLFVGGTPEQLNKSESRVLDAGYDGYWVSGHSNHQGVGVILGRAASAVEAKQIENPVGRVSGTPVETTLKKGLMSKEIDSILTEKIPGATMRAGILSIPVDSREAANDELARIGSGIRFSHERPESNEDRAKREFEEVLAKHKDTKDWLKAPNGKNSHLNERQWVQVRTPLFKEWFGDWEKAHADGGVWATTEDVSKAVDENGEPLVVYHGTDKGGFAAFNHPSGEKRGDLGIFTTPNLAMAQTYYSRRGGEIELTVSPSSMAELEALGYDFYGMTDDNDAPEGQYYKDANGDENGPFETEQEAIDDAVASFEMEPDTQSGYYAMFINIRNPNESDFEGANWEGSREGQYNVIDRDGEQVYSKDGKGVFDSYDEAQEVQFENPGSTVEGAADHYETTDSVVREASRDGYDGSFMQNVVDAGPGGGPYIDEPSDIFVALNPNQLKSASYNNGEFSVSTDDIRRSVERPKKSKSRAREIPESMDAITTADASFEFAKSKEFGTNREFKLAMQKRTQDAAKEGKLNLEDESEELHNYLVRVGVADAKSGLRDNANAVGWYDEKVKKALRLVGLIHPEINTDPEAKFAFIWALAVTSNGIKVNKNFELAELVYEEYKRTGKMPTNIKAGTTQKAINKSLGLFNKLRDTWGMEPLMRFMTTKLPVRDIEKSSNIEITGEGKNTEVYGAAILGPKIGNGFFMNLNGRFDQLTMDRWLMRTWGRWIGKLVDVDMTKVRLKREQLSGVIRMLSPEQKSELQKIIGTKLTVGNIDETSMAIWKASQKISLREKMNAVGELTEEQGAQLDELLGATKKNQVRESLGSEVRKLGNGLRGYLDGQIEAPGGSKQRNFIRSVFSGVLSKMREENPDLSMADLQAVVWYPEKLLYDAAKANEESDEGYSDDEAPDYANAAALLAAEKGVPSAKIKEAITDVDHEIQSAKRARDAQRAAGGNNSEAERTSGVSEQTSTGAGAGSVQEPGRVRRSLERLDGTSGTNQGNGGREEDGSLNGLPRSFTVDGKAIRASHWAPAEKVAQDYMKAAGLEYNPPSQYAKVDKERAARIANEYDRMEHDPQNPEVKAAYAAMIKEVAAQYKAIIDSGLKVEFIDYAKQGDPYAASPRLATEDVRKNNHMWVFSTRDGFGSSDFDVNDNPMLGETEFEISGQKALANDLFRVVHDYFGHVKEGVGFRADGEENTWRSHSAMLSPLAQRALTTETRGQNSWVNFGPHGDKNRTANGSDTHYADQKVGLLPLWVSEDGRGDDGGPDGGPDGGVKFDPNEPSIIRSAERPYFGALSELKLASGYKVGDFLATSKKLSWWDKTIGTPYHLAQKYPSFKRVFDSIQNFINDISYFATQAADLAPTILPKLEKLSDISKAALSAEDIKALSDPIFGGTLKYSRDENGLIQPEDDVEKAGVVFTDQELREYFQLDDRQIGLYHEFRNAVDRSISDLAVADMLRYLGDDGLGVRNRALNAGSLDRAVEEMSAHLDQLAQDNPNRAEVLQNTKEAIEAKAKQAKDLMARGYAPLSRFGQYTVYVTGRDGEQIYFGMFENEYEANKMAGEMRIDYPEATVETGTMSQESYKLFSGITPETLALFGESLGLEESGIDAKSEAFQLYLKLAKSNRSAMKRMIHRKGITGFSMDAGRVLAGFVYSNARQISTNLHAGEISKSAASIKEGDLKDHALKMMEYIQNPQQEAQAIRGLLFTQFIGGSVASALVNMTQPFTMTLPYLSQWGIGNASRNMKNALSLVAGGIKDDEELAKALKRAEDDGVVSPQEVHQLMAQAQGKGALQSGDGTKLGDSLAFANNSVSKLSLGWGKLFSTAEQFNRRVTFIASYNIAREQGIADPFAFAEKAINETQGVYNKGNKPAWARGAVGSTLFTFKQYSIAYVEFLQRMWGNGPEGKKGVGMALAVLFLVSGLGGMPGADDLDDVIDGIAQRVFNKSFNSKQAKKEWLSSFVGDDWADIILHGASSIPGVPIDVAGRMGLGNLVPGTGMLTKKKDYGSDYKELLGPAGTLFAGIGQAAAKIAEGDVPAALKSVAPVAAQNVIKGLDMLTMGYYRDDKGRKVVDTTAAEAAMKMIGFQPTSVANVQEATRVQQSLISLNKLRESEIADIWTAGRVENDPSKIEKAKKDLAEWNKENPDSPIKIDPSQINNRVKQANMDKAKRIAMGASKEMRSSVKKELESALPQ